MMLSRRRLFVLCAPVLALGCGGSGSNDNGATVDAASDGSAGGGDAGVTPDSATTDSGDAAIDAAPVACADRDKYKHVYFGDLHTHTSYSADAFGFATRNEPSDAWSFARGKPLQVAAAAPIPGPMVQIKRNLDFDAITDHSEWLAVSYACGSDSKGQPFDPMSPWTANCQPYLSQGNGGLKAIGAANQIMTTECGAAKEDQGACLAVTQSAWQSEQQMANAAYMPCTFTSFIAFEWTHGDPVVGSTLHKNVIFAGDHVPDHPFDAIDYPGATELWTALDAWIAQDPACVNGAPCAALTIPHNSNKSWGAAFAVPQTAGAIDQMRKYQKLAEIHQHKGDSECLYDPDAGAAEPQCNFEHLTPGADGPTNRQNYVRTALGNGIAAYADGGVNPLQLGIVGATDDHNGMPGSVAEDNWHGHAGLGDYGAKERLTNGNDKNPGGITGVWAEQNTRESIFAALSRRETFATSGVFISVRFYETWDATDYCTAGFPSNIIDAGGVAMGGTMQATGGAPGQSPYFYVSAAKDAADLAQVDVIKGTVTNGQVVETVMTMPAPSPGAFCLRWQDKSFDAKSPTFYYARVRQAPTPRWSHYDCQKLPGTAGCQAGGPLDVNVEERAWTSPIWSLP